MSGHRKIRNKSRAHRRMSTNPIHRKQRQLSLPGMLRGPENPWITKSLVVLRSGAKRGISISTLELCAGAGGQALGFEAAGCEHAGLLEIDKNACATLRLNRPKWNVIEADLKTFNATGYHGVDIVSGGLPCPPFSVAGKQLGERDERNLFPYLTNVVDQVRPKAVMIENVRGILDAVFDDYRRYVSVELKRLGYQCGWKLMNACDFGVPQLRPRVVFVAIRKEYAEFFSWPAESENVASTVGDTLFDLIAVNGWRGAKAWRARANEVAPTIVGGSLRHGGPDLGPTRSRAAWATLGVDGRGIANEPPSRDFVGSPRLTVRMVARLQGFPDDWTFHGGKTQSYRQVGNAFPPPVARAVAECLGAALRRAQKRSAVAV
jgi:DNA (cytosine-5)-methyltransferase 1